MLKEGATNEIREDFEREVEIMSAFDHDNILKLLGVVVDGKNGFRHFATSVSNLNYDTISMVQPSHYQRPTVVV